MMNEVFWQKLSIISMVLIIIPTCVLIWGSITNRKKVEIGALWVTAFVGLICIISFCVGIALSDEF